MCSSSYGKSLPGAVQPPLPRTTKIPGHVKYASQLSLQNNFVDTYSEVYPLDSECYAKYQGKKWMKGTVIRVYGNNCFDILFENGRKESRVNGERMAKEIGEIKI